MTVKPLFDKVVVESMEMEERTNSGFILPTASQEKQQMAKIVAVGPGGIIDGKEVTMFVKTGDMVITGKYTGTEVKVEGETYIIVSQNDILAIVE